MKTVTILQPQVWRGQQLDVTTCDTANVDTVSVAYLQTAKSPAVEYRFGEHYHAALHLVIECIPVHLLAVPVFRLFHMQAY